MGEYNPWEKDCVQILARWKGRAEREIQAGSVITNFLFLQNGALVTLGSRATCNWGRFRYAADLQPGEGAGWVAECLGHAARTQQEELQNLLGTLDPKEWLERRDPLVRILSEFLKEEQDQGRAYVHAMAKAPSFPAHDQAGQFHLVGA